MTHSVLCKRVVESNHRWFNDEAAMIPSDRKLLLLAFIALLAASLPAAAQLIHVPTETPEEGKAFSEFNHRMAGIFLLGIGILALLGNAAPNLAFLGKVWPFLFIIPGLYLAAMSDPEVWPMGTQSWIEAFQRNPEARQHKIYAVLLISLGVFELQRARGKLGKTLATWAFPALAVFGAVFLFFHDHTIDVVPSAIAQEAQAGKTGAAAAGAHAGHDMAGMSHAAAGEHGGHVMDETMMKVMNQHFWFSMVGFGIALSKFLYDGKFCRKPFVPFLWPSFMSVLGVLLILYAE